MQGCLVDLSEERINNLCISHLLHQSCTEAAPQIHHHETTTCLRFSCTLLFLLALGLGVT